jgi:hypothetical protein
MTKFIGGIQTILGIFAINMALSLLKKIPEPGTHLLTPAPNSSVESVLIILGAAIAILAIVQKLKHMKFAEVQILLGLVIVASSIFLYSESTSSYYYSARIYWLIYLILAAGGLTAVAVFMQFFVGGLRNEPGY